MLVKVIKCEKELNNLYKHIKVKTII